MSVDNNVHVHKQEQEQGQGSSKESGHLFQITPGGNSNQGSSGNGNNSQGSSGFSPFFQLPD